MSGLQQPSRKKLWAELFFDKSRVSIFFSQIIVLCTPESLKPQATKLDHHNTENLGE